MTYHPNPIETDEVALDPRIEAVAERLAEHAHEVWAEHRLARGPDAPGDDAERANPRLVPFAELPESEKEFDRRAALEPIKALKAMGWRFVPPGPAAPADSSAPPEIPPPPPDDDLIARARQAHLDTIGPAFDQVDRQARLHQLAHNVFTVAAAVFGTVAVVLAIVQLSRTTARFTPEQEVTAALIALTSVVLGVASTLLPRWLLYRFKAERLRSMEFQLLADPDLWRGDRTRSRLERVAKDVAAIKGTSMRRLHRWLVLPPSSSLLAAPIASLDEEAVGRLADHYLSERVSKQRDYFRRRYFRLRRMDQITRLFPPVVFFLSVFFAFLHFVLHLVADRYEAAGKAEPAATLIHTGVYCTLLAATLPVVGAGVRTLRSAFEYGRNTLRYRAAHYALTRLANRLRPRYRAAASPQEVLRDLAFCEHVLLLEHREWLRLMVEAEWYA